MVQKNKGRILFVDDSPIIQKVGSKILLKKGFEVSLANNGQDALRLFGNNVYDLIILDYHMPKLNGLQVINALRNTHNSVSSYNIPILILSGENDETIINRLLASGADDYIYKQNLLKTPEIFLEKIYGLLKFQEELVKFKKVKLHRTLSPVVMHFYRFGKEFIANYLRTRVVAEAMLKKLYDELDSINKTMEEGNIIELVCDTPDLKDYLISHSINSAILVIYFCGFSLKWEWDKTKQVAAGAFLHDFGNLDEKLMLLHSPTELTEEEFRLYKSHVDLGVEVAKKAGLNEVALEYVSNHHERSNGSGYPAGKKEEEMSDVGLIASIIDTFDTLTFSRGINKKMIVKEAMRKMYSWGNQYSEQYLNKFEDLTRELELKQDEL
ncbi:MAG: response regulator [Nitrospinae bacterium]|nr:response regulator [Nitrospinota bacterium]